jgi:hypothetical protein
MFGACSPQSLPYFLSHGQLIIILTGIDLGLWSLMQHHADRTGFGGPSLSSSRRCPSPMEHQVRERKRHRQVEEWNRAYIVS